jgi:hypothetical protein
VVHGTVQLHAAIARVLSAICFSAKEDPCSHGETLGSHSTGRGRELAENCKLLIIISDTKTPATQVHECIQDVRILDVQLTTHTGLRCVESWHSLCDWSKWVQIVPRLLEIYLGLT